ncbi:hypothetical protein Dsin_001701 [Dipteronia sinensis]|uniref:Protein FAR1-RELATED SEQUENCE n=1 Tax=Dipteronia sinensis TaxID=43782 RepID=A0AAE0B5U4_9ROSI|nr:hypothetical protein Dsin_001701 [Dipteronia sinensis]
MFSLYPTSKMDHVELSSNSLDITYIPQVRYDCKSKLGQEFASLKEVLDFYNDYAKEAGFSVRVNSSKKSKDNIEIVRKEYVCSKEGKSFLGENGERKMRRREENIITHCFWADATLGRSNKYFGDVVVFDTTYNTNRYGMIFAPLVGVNNYGQSTLFGCSFLSNETTDSFIWLFEQFKRAMPGAPPKMIITNQDPAMAKAIAQTLQGNTIMLFKNAYGIPIVWKILSLNGWRAIAHQLHEELIVNHIDINEKPLLKLPLEMEKQMSEIYTRKRFQEFQDELSEHFSYKVELMEENDVCCMFKVLKRDGGSTKFEIVYQKE